MFMCRFIARVPVWGPHTRSKGPSLPARVSESERFASRFWAHSRGRSRCAVEVGGRCRFCVSRSYERPIIRGWGFLECNALNDFRTVLPGAHRFLYREVHAIFRFFFFGTVHA